MKPFESLTKATLHTVIIQTSHLNEMADFYAAGLELGKPSSTGGDHLGLLLPNTYLGFDHTEKPPEPSGVVSLWFEVENLEETFERFKKMGAEIKYPPTPKPWEAVLAALYDPDGNLFGLTQRGKGLTG
jgi:predicted enzyme related to lactoylglutathione lyase